MAKVLVVDDEEGVRSFVADALRGVGHEVAEAEDGQAAAERVAREAFPIVITDVRMPRMDGMALLKLLRAEHPDTEVILLTAHGSVETAVTAMKLGAFDYLQKPIGSPADLRHLVARADERHRLSASREIAMADAEPALSHGAPAMDVVVRALGRVAKTDASVLLLGESGTGKEVAARAVHRQSPRASGPFVAISCAALPDTLLESELFGHERGAFTGAATRRRGRLELADGGTFFLDEIGELRLDLQAKLLRVLQERRFERLGGNQTVATDVRFIAATHRDLAAMVADGRFREDLYHRLAVFPVRLPALRERREDVLPIARVLLARVAKSLGRPALSLDPSAEAAILAADWPGNVRELANALERAAILADGDRITEGDIVALVGGLPADAGAVGLGPGKRAESIVPSMAEAEREAIARALSHYGGNRRKVAEHLGIGLRTLYEKLKRYELERRTGGNP